MTAQDISTHILADWLPTLPTTLSPSLISWPPFLLETVSVTVGDCLALKKLAAQSERQWKGFVSWMFGVAGTRHVLDAEGYRWIAPLSAFYPENTQPFVASPWNIRFPPSSIRAERLAGSQSRLRPDYLAIRPLPGSDTESTYEFAVAESKGTHQNLESRSNCPPDWSNQARNVSLTVGNAPITIPRHLVVATRVNPNAKRLETRRLQVRAWNKAEESHESVPPDAIADIIAVQIFSLFLNLGLYETARAIALSVSGRQAMKQDIGDAEPFRRRNEAIHASDTELRSKAAIPTGAGAHVGGLVVLDTARGTIEVAVATPTMTLVKNLREARSYDDCYLTIKTANSEIDKWLTDRRADINTNRSILLSLGAEITFPENWARP